MVLAAAATIDVAINARRESKLSSSLLLGTMVWWLACSALETMSVSPSTKELFVKLGLACLPLVPGTLLVFALQFSGLRRWVTPTIVTFIQLPSLAGCLLALTNASHNLVWGPVALDTTTTPVSLVKDMGPAFLGFIVYASLILLIAFALLLRRLRGARRLHRRQIRTLLLGMVVLAVAMAVNKLRFASGVQIALEPYAVLVFSLIVARNLELLHTSDIVSVAQAVVVDQLPDAVLVVDSDGAASVWNAAAVSMFAQLQDETGRLHVSGSSPQLAERLDLGSGQEN